nr:immunoglobulin light chain junction region [Macaca mulatta]
DYYCAIGHSSGPYSF